MSNPNVGKLMTFELPAIDGQPTIEGVKKYLLNGIQSFEGDPADSDFQRGYQSALETIYGDLFMTQAERAGTEN